LARFATTESSPLAKRGTTNEEAYRFYLQGRSLMNQRSDEDVKKAVEYFEKAIRLDSNFARGYSSTALAYDFLGKIEKAKKYVKRALELDSNLAEAYAVRGKMDFSVEWNFDSSEKDLLRAIELEPNNDLAHWAYALLLSYRGRFDEAVREIETALTIAPATVMYSRDRARILYYARRYDEAIAQFKKAIEVDEKFGSVWGQLWMAYEMNGNGDEDYRTFIKWKEISKDEYLEDYKKTYAVGGWLGVKRKILEFDKRAEHEPDTNFFAMARGCATLGEKEQAFEYLNKAFDKHQLQMVFLKVEPQLDSLRDDPRFDELVKRVGFEL
ncbi:MAG TPA: tetratricopeptide repeat protein, partial [Pyrinomonadaceae bacterium]|nr:tetratricopeptide repeat protein [Pyrinomonadaceae bacterium]